MSNLDRNSVETLTVDPDGSLYAGDLFSTAGNVEANRIARWNGSQWDALDSGMNHTVQALTTGPDGSLYAGGAFTTAGGRASSHIARWGELPPTAVGLASFEAGANLGAAAQVGLVVVALVLALAAEASLASRRGKIGVKDYPPQECNL